jgi:hypothetical protein
MRLILEFIKSTNILQATYFPRRLKLVTTVISLKKKLWYDRVRAYSKTNLLQRFNQCENLENMSLLMWSAWQQYDFITSLQNAASNCVLSHCSFPKANVITPLLMGLVSNDYSSLADKFPINYGTRHCMSITKSLNRIIWGNWPVNSVTSDSFCYYLPIYA